MNTPPADPAIARLIEIAAREMALGMTIVEAPSGHVIYRNRAAEQVLGTPVPTEAFDLLGQRIAPAAWPGLRTLDGSTVVAERMEIVRDGQRRTISVNASPVRDLDGVIIAGVVTYEDVTDARRTEDAATFLAAAGALLEKFDRDMTLQRIADLAVPRLADWCFVHLVEDGRTTCAAMAAADVIKLVAARASSRDLVEVPSDTPLARVLAGGPRELVQMTDEMMAAIAKDEHHLAGMRSRGYRSVVVAPLTGRGGVLGAITFAMTDSTRRYEEEDLEMLVELARRTGPALENARLFAAEQEARRRAEQARDRTRRLQQLTATLSGALTEAEVAAIMVEAGCAALGAASGLAWMLDDTDTLVLVAHEKAWVGGQIDRYRRVPMSAPMPVCDVVRNGSFLLFESRAAMARDYPASAPGPESPFGAWAVIPFMVRGRGVGAVGFGFDRERDFDDDDRALLVAMLGQASLAMERARLFAAEQAARLRAEQARDRTRGLQQLTSKLSGALAKVDVAQILVDAGCAALGADGGVAWMFSADGQNLEIVAHDLRGQPPVVDRFQVHPVTAEMPTSAVARTGKAALYENRDEFERDYPGMLAAAKSVFHAWAFVPMHAGGRPLGVLTFPFLQPRRFSDEERDLIDAMIGQAALAMERASLFEEVRAKQDQLQHALAAAHAATWTIDLATMTTTRDESYKNLVGLREDQGVADYEGVHPDDRAALREELQRTLASGVPFEPEVRVRRGDGSYIWVRSHGRLLRDAQGTPVSLAGVMVDIDEAKRASLRAEGERRITETLNRLGMSFASELDHERLAQRITDEVTALLGAAYGVFFYEVAGRQALSLHPTVAGDAAGARQLFAAGTAPLLRTTTLGRELVRRDDAQIEGIRSYLAVPVIARSGEMYGSLLFGHPEPHRFTAFHEQLVASIAAQAGVALENARLYGTVRDQKNQLEVAVERAQLADRRKDEFLAMLGHELRNPLAPISTALELMELKAAGSMQRERDVIRRQVTHMTRLVDDLLDVSRITRGKIELTREVLEIGAVIAKAVEMVSPLLEKRGQRLVLEVPQAGLHVDGDATRLAQVFQNLLTNAAKYSDQGSTIVIRARANRTRIAVEIVDQGIGIPPELLLRLFDLFVQGERAIDRSQGGLGIGLTLAKSLVELHGGTIEAASPGRDQGSTFTVWLPRADALRTTPVPEVTRAARTTSGLRVMIVDDNVDAAHTLHELLSALGHDSAVAHDGPSALQLAATFRPDVGVLDIGLPVMDGFELARRLRESLADPKLRLIAVTGYGQEADRVRVREAGFDHHLVKPVALDQLVPLIGS